LKKRIRELKVSLSPKPLFVEPLLMIVLDKFPEGVNGSSSKFTRDVKLLMGVRKYVAKIINKIIDIIMEAMKIATEASVMARRLCSLKEFLQKVLQTDEQFYKNVVSTFLTRMSSTDELTILNQDFRSKKILNQIRLVGSGG
jgi:hypothetical protein